MKRNFYGLQASREEDEDVVGYISTDDDDNGKHNAECPMCNKLYSEDNKGQKWIRCSKCSMWSHENCDDKITKTFICNLCIKNKTGTVQNYNE